MTEIAFRADDGHLRAHPDDPGLTNRQAGVMALTSPSIAGLLGGSYVIAFQDNDGHLRAHPDDVALTNRKAGIDGRTSPSVIDAFLIV